MSEKKGMSAKTVTIAVAVIGAAATLGAALISNWDKGNDHSPAIQQTANGQGAVNAARDAYVTNNISKSPGEEAAERVQACEGQHGMKTSTERKNWTETAPAGNGGPEASVEHADFRSCEWPKSRYADADGFLEIKVSSVTGPGDFEASGVNMADRITAPCPQLTLSYQFGKQGDFQNEPSITVSADTIVTVDGKPWTGAHQSLPFYPDEGEFVVLRNDSYEIASARCQ